MSGPPTGLTLDNCDKEPIHIPGNIQSFGGLLAGPMDLSRADFASANLDQMLGVAPGSVLDGRLDRLLPQQTIHDARNVLSYTTSKTQRERVGTMIAPGGRALEVYAHVNPERLAVLEFEEAPAPDNERRSAIDTARLFLAKAGEARTIDELLRIGAVGLRELTGYDRVKAYRYAADGSGEVVSESRSAQAPSFLGLRYPAWDVPAQARALQIRNPVRILASINDAPVPILSHAADAPPLDLSLAHLRGVSPIHVQYLRNMEVEATLTVGLIVDGALWGMFACHHLSPRLIRSETRIAAELYGQLMSLMVKQRLEADVAQARSRTAAARQKIVAEADEATDLLHGFPDMANVMRSLIDCDGLAVMREDKLQTDGSVPSAQAIHAIAGHLDWDAYLLEATERLEAAGWHRGHELQQTAGCLIVRATAAFPLELMFFRDEVVRQVRWAGNPEKDYDTGPWGSRITPRGSFEAYLEEQAGRSAPWSHIDLAAAREIQTMLTQITAKDERSQLARHKELAGHRRQQDLMIAELNHRVKNILALIRSLSRQAKASSTSLESYALALEQRIAALAAAHDLAVTDTMSGVSLRTMLETELGPYVRADQSQVILSGPDLGLRADVAPIIALVFHEVVSNAVKYGALSTATGVVQVRWSVSDDGLDLTWRELGGPEVSPPTRHGFGRTLIERAIAYEFDGESRLDFPPTGAVFALRLPADALTEAPAPPEKAPKVAAVGRLAAPLGDFQTAAAGLSVLVVEDNVVLAMDMVDSLTRLGAAGIATAPTLEAATKELSRQVPDLVVLDMNIRGTVSFDLAERLVRSGVPFFFVTGYGSTFDMPEELRGVKILTKPVSDSGLSKAIGALFGGDTRDA